MESAAQSNVISIARIYDAPLPAIWAAWTVPEEVAQWWGPRGFTLTTHSRDLRTGGHWHYTMHGPDGTDYENTTQYLEVLPMQRLVYDHGGHKDRPPLFRVTALFTECDGRTRMDMRMAFATPEIAVEMRGFIRKAGGETTWDRLAEYLGKRIEGKELFFIARAFDASIERVYDMWVKPEFLAQWLPPTGATLRFLRADPQVGGSSLYEMRFGQGEPMHGLVKYLELNRPSRIVYTQQFCDASERVMRPPFFKNWPLLMRTTAEFDTQADQSTRVTIRWEPADATPEDLAEFVSQRTGLTAGWTGSLDKLESLLA